MIGNDRYLIEIPEQSSEISVKKFQVFRNYTMMNDNLIDTDLYFVDEGIKVDNIIWPQSELSVVPLMSNDPATFNESFTSSDIVYDYLSRNDSRIVDDELYEKNVKTIKIRIWHPTTSIRKDMILYCDSWVNSVHYHWMCKKLSDMKNDTGKEIRINQDIYTEYFEVEIPDLRDILFGKTYIVNNFPIVDNKYSDGFTRLAYDNKNIMEESLHNKDEHQLYLECPNEYSQNPNVQLIDLNLLTRQWKYSNGNSREYVNDGIVSFGSIGLNVTLYPWKSVSDNKTYTIDKDYSPASCQFCDDMKFSISPSLEFIDGSISIVGKLRYSDIFDNIYTAWQTIYKTSFSTYPELSDKIKDDEEAMEILGNNSAMVKYSCIISSDNLCKYVIHEENAYADKVDDFSFPMKDLFSSWNEVPNALFMTLVIEDRAVGKNCLSPTILVTKEKLKYMINDRPYVRLSIQDKQSKDMNKENFNFINTINCRITRSSDTSQNISSRQVTPRIIYKPIFFRVQELQTISLRSNLIQNIGISLSEYASKVDEFVLTIGENKWYEKARTGSFVIFSIDPKTIQETSGKYDIVTSDNDYISSGTYTIS